MSTFEFCPYLSLVRPAVSSWMTIWICWWRQESMPFGNLISISLRELSVLSGHILDGKGQETRNSQLSLQVARHSRAKEHVFSSPSRVESPRRSLAEPVFGSGVNISVLIGCSLVYRWFLSISELEVTDKLVHIKVDHHLSTCILDYQTNLPQYVRTHDYDAISTTLHLALTHLDNKDSYVRMLFIDFSSAFNTIIPQHLIEKLNLLGLNTSLCNWILDFLTERPQSIRIGNSISNTTTLSTGAPQGCVLSPLLFTLLTHDCVAMHNSNHIIKFADDTTVVGLISKNDESAYREEVQQLTACSAFNKIIAQHLIEKLNLLGLNTSLCNWILDFLTERRQSIRIGNSISNTTTLSTGAPQGCVLSPLLFTLLTHDCVAMHSSNHIIKFADDTTVVGLISKNDESAYREEVQQLTAWCGANNLSLNVDKTKEMIVDFRRAQSDQSSLIIDGSSVEIVKSTKFLGVHLADNLTWSLNTSSITKKAQQRLYFLRRLRKTHLPPPILSMFYRGTNESILSSCITAWFGNCTVSDRKSLQRIVRTAEKIIGISRPSIMDIYTTRCIRKAHSIVDDHTHTRHTHFLHFYHQENGSEAFGPP
ncbi:gastrula zinc finger protein XlCGF28.1-like [Silurus asotus]|uniref:Gastrula zinc finger protein XlCGF28.1-like n=1 Tax=Silurus asotus TaxID=30991 RepID=A0AAD4ZZ36_SILAS|nr:gastrula zinc finger protein XlCGF28.1-like [Silurus asotus]